MLVKHRFTFTFKGRTYKGTVNAHGSASARAAVTERFASQEGLTIKEATDGIAFVRMDREKTGVAALCFLKKTLGL